MPELPLRPLRWLRGLSAVSPRWGPSGGTIRGWVEVVGLSGARLPDGATLGRARR